jgi:hypothetical protein
VAQIRLAKLFASGHHVSSRNAQKSLQMAVDAKADFYYSRLRERIVEHVFIGDALRTLWRKNIFDVEVLRSEFDAHGYDVVMTRGPIVRHIQFKTGKAKKPGDVIIALALADKASGCVIWTRIGEGLELGPYYWFGGRPGKKLPSIATYPKPLRTTHNKQGTRPLRQNHRKIPGVKFRLLPTLSDVLEALFGRV